MASVQRKFLSNVYTLTSSIVDKQNAFLNITNENLYRDKDNEQDVLNEILNYIDKIAQVHQSKCVDFALFYLHNYKDDIYRPKDQLYRLHACLFMVTHNFIGGSLFKKE